MIINGWLYIEVIDEEMGDGDEQFIELAGPIKIFECEHSWDVRYSLELLEDIGAVFIYHPVTGEHEISMIERIIKEREWRKPEWNT